MPTTALDALPWSADPADLVVAADGDDAAIRLARYLRAVQPAWFVNAECRLPQHAHISFFPPRGASAQPALQLCGKCPVVLACRAWSLSDPDPTGGHGIAGGATAPARRAARIARRRNPEVS